MPITRESIRNGFFQNIAAEAERCGYFRPLSAAERRASWQAILAEAGPETEVWVFAYGSLMWNPAFHYAERRPGTVYGYHRRYCMWSGIGRGSPERPGLMLGLDRGGSCRGVVYRVAPESIEEELDIIWAREMLSGAYRPRWLTVRTSDGPIRAIAFVINRDHERYAGRLPMQTVVRHLATAKGRLGSCRDYLASTVAHLETLGIRDGTMHDLLRRVDRYDGEDRW